MRSWGWLVLVLGLVWLAVAFNMNVTVETGSIYGPDRVINLDLLTKRQNHLMASGLVALVGALMAIFGVSADASEGPQNEEKDHKLSDQPPCDRDLQLDQYRLWLAAKYNISRNELFERYVLNGEMFETLEEALTVAHSKDLEFAKSSGSSEAAADEIQQTNQNLTDTATEDVERKRELIALSLAFLGMAAFVILPLVYYGSKGSSGQKADGLVGTNAATFEKSLGFIPPNDWQLVEDKVVEADDNLAALCFGSAGRLFRFETAGQQPTNAVQVLNKAIGGGSNLLEGLNFGDAESRAYKIKGGRTLYLTALKGGNLYLCVAPGS